MIYQYTLGIIESILETVFTILAGLTNSYFLSLILLAIIVRFATKPLEKYVNRAMKSQAEIDAILTPQIQEIKKNHSGADQHHVIKRLYARYSYHPAYAIRSLAGIAVQLPFFIAAYFMLLNYSQLNGVVIPFLGDLGKPDSLIFGKINLMPFVMTFVNILALITLSMVNRKNLIQGLFIALMFLILLYKSPLGLLIYWTTSNLFSLFSNFSPQISQKLNVKSLLPKSKFKDTYIGRFFEEYGYLFFITNLAISIPLLGILGEQFSFFTAHGLSGNFILISMLLISLIPTVILILLRKLSKTLGFVKMFDKISLFIFLGLFFFYMINKAGYGSFPKNYEPYLLFIIAILVTFIFVTFVFKKQFLKNISYLALIIPLIFLNFIFATPAASLFKKYDNNDAFPETKQINDTPVFLLIYDEFSGLTLQNRKGQLDKERYPGFAELAAQSDYFPNALTPYQNTNISVPSIASGTLRRGKNKKGLAKGENLLELFKAKSSIDAYSSVLPKELLSEEKVDKVTLFSDLLTLYLHIISHQDWIESKIGVIPQAWKGFGIFFNTSDKHHSYELKLKNWIENKSKSGDIKQFNFLHDHFPHAPYTRTPLGRSVLNNSIIFPEFIKKEQFIADQSLVNVLYHNYIQQSFNTDQLTLEFIRLLKSKKLFDKSLIIITSDHGVSYNKKGDNRRNPRNEDSWKNIISVPLFIKYPKQKEPRVNSSFVTTMDIAPTILDIVGIDSPWKSIGQSLKNIPNNSKTSSVKSITEYKKYFKNISKLFVKARIRKNTLFSEASPIHAKAVNYTENKEYDPLLNKNVTTLKIGPKSKLSGIFESSSEPIELTHFGVINQGADKINNKIIAAVIDNEVQAIFKTAKSLSQDGFFAFSLPEKNSIPNKLDISLYEIKSIKPFTLNPIEIIDYEKHQNLLKSEYEIKSIYSYDWKNLVNSNYGIDSLTIIKDGIQAKYENSNDPYIIFNKLSNEPFFEPIFKIDIESSRDISFRFYYQTKHNPKFNGAQSIANVLKKGENTIYIKIPEKDVFGKFRLDIGIKNIKTEVLIKNIEIKK